MVSCGESGNWEKVRKNKIRPLLNSVKAIGRGPGVFQRSGPFRFFKRLSPLAAVTSCLVRLCNSRDNSPFSLWRKRVAKKLLYLFPWQESSGLISFLLFALAEIKWGFIFAKEKCLETFYCHLSILFYIAVEIIIDHIAVSDVFLKCIYRCGYFLSEIFLVSCSHLFPFDLSILFSYIYILSGDIFKFNLQRDTK